MIPSFHSQAVAIAAYRMGFDAAAPASSSPPTRAAGCCASVLAEKGIRHILGRGTTPSSTWAPWIDRGGMADSAAMGAYLAERHGLAVVPGVYFSEFGGRWIRFSYALPPETARRAVTRLGQALAALGG